MLLENVLDFLYKPEVWFMCGVISGIIAIWLTIKTVGRITTNDTLVFLILLLCGSVSFVAIFIITFYVLMGDRTIYQKKSKRSD